MLVGDTRQRIQTAASSTCEDHTFHLFLYFPGLIQFRVRAARVANYCREQIESQSNTWAAIAARLQSNPKREKRIFHANRDGVTRMRSLNSFFCSDMQGTASHLAMGRFGSSKSKNDPSSVPSSFHSVGDALSMSCGANPGRRSRNAG